MELYHVSTQNRSLDVLDMSRMPKQDFDSVKKLVDDVRIFPDFYKELNSSKMQQFSLERGWIKEKIAAEAIFEYVRREEFKEKPSRLYSAYYTASSENAYSFNRRQRGGRGAIFVFTADESKSFCFNMDIFHKACVCFQEEEIREESVKKVVMVAREYWKGYENIASSNSEILYLGNPILEKYKEYENE